MSNVTVYDLPDEILEYIFYFLPPYDDIRNCMVVSKKWYEIAKNVIPRVKQKFSEAISVQNVTWEFYGSKKDGITKRYAHSTCRHNGSMYVFGGSTSSFTSFNDLWKLDLSTKTWTRISVKGKCPVPKAGAIMVSHKNKLIVFGGLLPTQVTMFQTRRVSNYLHIYDIIENQWTEINCSLSGFQMPGLAGHSATIHNDKIVIFGGLGERLSINDVYTFDLMTNAWEVETIDSEKPSARYGHSQLYINEEHFMIMGGISSEPVVESEDAWLFDMTNNEKWFWRKIDLGIHAPLIRNVWCHPVCKVGKKIVVFKPIGNPGMYAEWFPIEVSRNTEANQEVNLNGKRGILNRAFNVDSTHDNNKLKKSYRNPEHFLPPFNEFRSPIMEMHVMDTSKLLEDGCLNYVKSKYRTVICPTDTILYSIIEGNGELIMFGGIQQDINFNHGADEIKNEITNTLRVIKIKKKII